MLVRSVLSLVVVVAIPFLYAGESAPAYFKCQSVSARDQCNLGLTCATPGADCQRCTTDPTLRVKRCVQTETPHSCLSGSGPAVACGERIVGSCGSDGFGGYVCIGFPSGDCGTIVSSCQ